MAKPLISAKTVFVILCLIGFSVAVRVFLAPPDTYIYGPDGKWLEDPGDPTKALDMRQFGHSATWRDGQWIDEKNQVVKIGPPPPRGYKQDESNLEKATGPDGKKAVWYAKNDEWLDESGNLIWRLPTH